MRHNLHRAGAPRGRAIRTSPVTILLLFASISFSSLAAEQEKKDSPQKNPGGQENVAPSERQGPSLDEIDRAWMQSIQGARENTGQSFSNPGGKAEASPGNPQDSANPAEGPRAEEAPANQEQEGPAASRMFTTQEGPSFFSLFIRFVLFMGLMGAGFYGLVRFMKKKSGIVSSSAGGPLRVVASISLMPGKYMQIVDMAGQLMVLGVSDQGVRLIQTVEDGSVADRIRLWEENRPEPAENLLQGLQSIFKTTDLRLWKSRKEGKEGPDFQAILSGRSESEDVPMEELENLLQQQNRRLRAVTNKPRPGDAG